MPPQFHRFADGRLHLQHGPIDLIIEAFGPAGSVDAAYAGAAARFATILDELCAELPLLRAPARADGRRPAGRVARRMADAVAPFCADAFITPMASVAGAVAEEVLEAMTAAARLTRAYVNNGGDIALHLGPGEAFAVGMVERPDHPALFGRAQLRASDAVRGIATSGRHGRSFSLGIADAVTVLARTAALADAAATLIANAVDLPGHPAVERRPATDLDPQSDLGERPVTVGLAPLTAAERDTALAAGAHTAEGLLAQGHVAAAALHLRGETRVVAGATPGVVLMRDAIVEAGYAASDGAWAVARRDGSAAAGPPSSDPR